MLKFFSKIRKNLLSKGQTGQYLKYALGEILLVVLGILIALQINNWNEKRKLQKEELEVLQNFHQALQLDLKAQQVSFEMNGKIKKSINLLLDYMEKDLPYHDSLKYHFSNTNNIWDNEVDVGVFEAVKSKDLNIISNRELRSSLSKLYHWAEGDYKFQQQRYRILLEEASTQLLNTRFDEFWGGNYEEWSKKNHFENKDIGYDTNELIGEATPVDFESLKKDQEYLYYLKSLRNRYNWYLEIQTRDMITSIEELMGELEEEIAAKI